MLLSHLSSLKMENTNKILTVGFMNIRGQTGLSRAKQVQIESFLTTQRLDVLHLQEIHIGEDSFSNCDQICSSYNIISNNAASKYGTASIVKSDLIPENILMDTKGRAIVFNIDNLTLSNLYLPSGTDASSRAQRENYFSETIPQLLLNRLDAGLVGGDMNCITHNIDSTHHPEAKKSPSLARLLKTFDMVDSFRSLLPTKKIFSHYYNNPGQGGGQGATRIDRSYNWGEITVKEARYEPVAFSDHMAYIVTISIPSLSSSMLSPRSRPLFKVRPEVIFDKVFQERLGDSMADWKEVKDNGLDVLLWWDIVVKPGVKKLAIQRSKELNLQKRGELNLLLIQQAYLAKKLFDGDLAQYAHLRCVQVHIQKWYEKESEKVLLQSRSDEVNNNEKVRIYHHDLHKKHLKRSSILKLQTEEGVIEGHQECASYLESQVGHLLLNPGVLDTAARDVMLNEIEQVFTEEDNTKLLSRPTMVKVKKVIAKSNLYAAPGTDGIPSLLYSKCWDVMGPALTEVIQEIHAGAVPTKSMRTCLMVFGSKPKKLNSIKPGDKRRISLLNSDFKALTGLEAEMFGDTATHTLSPVQLVAGSDRRIHHGINLARDAINQAGKSRMGCGLLDLDFLAGFDWLEMEWVYMVMAKKGVAQVVIDRIRRIYADSTTTVVVNNILGETFPNIRGSLRQGDVPSMYWFGVGIDPLLIYLDRRLAGIPIIALPAAGPTSEGAAGPVLPPVQQHYKVVAYADDVKPSITSMQEFHLVDKACALLERASGVKLHRDPSAGKVKFLPLGRWKGSLTQEDLPHQYVQLSDHLDFVGVELRATFQQTRKVNGDQLQQKVKNTVGPWKAGRFMPLTLRPFSANTYALSKVWFKCGSVNLRNQDIDNINSQVKSWLYQDCLEKPSELILHRDTQAGGLGLFNVKIRSLALLIRSFLETASNPKFRHSLLHEVLFRYHVLGEDSLPNPGFLPYYDQAFFSTIRHYKETCPLNISIMTTKQWYRVLLEDRVLMNPGVDGTPPALLPTRVEVLMPHQDWPATWLLAKTKGLSSENSSFLFKLVHQLLPTQDRVHRITNDPGVCKICRAAPEDRLHAFSTCPSSKATSDLLLGYVHAAVPGLSPEDMLRLNFASRLDESDKLAVLVVISTGLKYIWESRLDKKVVHQHKMRAEIEACISILRKSRYCGSADRVLELIV